MRYFRWCDIHEHIDLDQEQDPLNATPLAGPNDFSVHFMNLLSILWDECMVYENELRVKQPPRLPMARPIMRLMKLLSQRL